MERLGGGDLCYNALSRHKNSTKGDCMDSQRVLTIDLRYGGLGDQLFWSHIPRIAKDRTNKGGGEAMTKSMCACTAPLETPNI